MIYLALNDRSSNQAISADEPYGRRLRILTWLSPSNFGPRCQASNELNAPTDPASRHSPFDGELCDCELHECVEADELAGGADHGHGDWFGWWSMNIAESASYRCLQLNALMQNSAH